MAYTEFYCDAAAGANVNAGDKVGVAPTTTTNGAYTQGGGAGGTDLFTAASGTPFSTAAAGDFVSVYNDAATLTTFIGRITAVNGGGASVDISLTAISGTRPTTVASGKTATIGGVWEGPNGAEAFPVGFIANTLTNSAGDYPRVNLKNGTNYAITAAMTSLAGPCKYEGYTSAVGDGGMAVIDGSNPSASYIMLQPGANNHWQYVIFQNNGATTGTSNGVTASGGEVLMENCVFSGMRGSGIAFTGAGNTGVALEAFGCNKSNSAGFAGIASTSAGGATLIRCISHDNTGSNALGFNVTNTATLVDCIADSNGADGFNISSIVNIMMLNCDAYLNGGDGIDLSGASAMTAYIENCNLIQNTGWGITSSGSSIRSGAIRNCGFGSGTAANGSGDINTNTGGISITGTVTYGSNLTPWNAPSTGDFRIVLAAAKGTGLGTFTETAASYTGTIAYPDIGAAQHQDSPSTVSGGAAPCQRNLPDIKIL